jgi:protein involved in polysaccharide export with SLBB domain
MIICLGGLSLLISGCVIQPIDGSLPSASGSPVVAMNEGSEYSGAYKLRPLDPIYIRFSGISEQQTLDLVIDENGEISLLHIEEPINAADLTTSQLEDEIERLYVNGGIYKNVSVNVTMTAKVYYMQGEVNGPGQYQLMSGTTLLQAIAGASGYTPYANRRKVTITRHGKILTYNAKALEKDPSKDVKIEAGDVIKVWQSIF